MSLITPTNLIDGLHAGIALNWNLRKHSAEIKPEYLLTVVLATHLSNAGLCNGDDADFELEAKTLLVVHEIVTGHLAPGYKGLTEWFRLRSLVRDLEKAEKAWRKNPGDALTGNALVTAKAALRHEPTTTIGRDGKVDLFVRIRRLIPASMRAVYDSFVVEMKGFDPPDNRVALDVVRLKELHLLNQGRNDLMGGYLIYPSMKTRTASALKIITERELISSGLAWQIHSVSRSTGETPEEGMAGYTALCLEIVKKPKTATPSPTPNSIPD
jgi:hypothetical protein